MTSLSKLPRVIVSKKFICDTFGCVSGMDVKRETTSNNIV